MNWGIAEVLNISMQFSVQIYCALIKPLKLHSATLFRSEVDLSPLGIQQAHELGNRRGTEHFDAIFCSDLLRSYKTAEIAFGNTFPIGSRSFTAWNSAGA